MTGEGRPTVACVGDDDGTVAEACRAAGATVTDEPVEAEPGGDRRAIVAVGDAAVREVCLRKPADPVLAVDADSGFGAVAPADVEDAVESVLAGDTRAVSHHVLDVRLAGESRTSALLDALLVTAEPAHISAYEVRYDGEPVDRFRADGVVVATPAGTAGYARAAGGPVIAPGEALCAVVPIANFATASDHWVLPAAATELRVCRAETAVELAVDGVEFLAVDRDEPVSFAVAGTVTTLRVAASSSPFGPPDQSEKL